MSSVIANVQKSIAILDDIQNAIISKGVDVPTSTTTSQYVDKVREIDEWKPHPDWWDIDEIWNNDTNQYRKMIVLTDYSAPLVYTLSGKGIKGYCTSDNPYFIVVNTTSDFTITMTGIGDRYCRDGYKTRWVFIFYDDTFRDVGGINLFSNKTIRYIIHNLDYIGRSGTMSNFYTAANLEFIKSKGLSDWVISTASSTNCLFISLKNKVLRLANENDISYPYLFKENPHVKKTVLVNGVVKCSKLNSAFFKCYMLEAIDGILDVTNTDSAVNALGYCAYLRDVKIYCLKCHLDLSTCYSLSRESLLYLLLNAQDVSSNPQTLTLGATNLVKLSDTEKAIATTKGWILV